MSFIEYLIPPALRRGMVFQHPEFGNVFVKVSIAEQGIDITAENEAGKEVKVFCSLLALMSNHHKPKPFLAETIKGAMLRLAEPKVWCAEWCLMDSWRFSAEKGPPYERISHYGRTT